MNIPSYIIKAQSAELIPKELSKIDALVKKLVKVIIILIILFSLFFRENLFFELSWTARIILIVLAVTCVFQGGSDYKPYPMEIRFYEDYMEFFFEERYCSKKLQRQELYTMSYDKTRIVYERRDKALKVYGDANHKMYNYDKNRNLPETPSKVKDYEDGLFVVFTQFSPEIDFVKEIEEHSPIKVVVE